MLKYTYNHKRLSAYWEDLKHLLMDSSFVSDLAYDRQEVLRKMDRLAEEKHGIALNKKQQTLLIKRLLFIVKLFKLHMINMHGKVIDSHGLPEELLHATNLPIEVVIEMEVK